MEKGTGKVIARVLRAGGAVVARWHALPLSRGPLPRFFPLIPVLYTLQGESDRLLLLLSRRLGSSPEERRRGEGVARARRVDQPHRVPRRVVVSVHVPDCCSFSCRKSLRRTAGQIPCLLGRT